MEDSDEKQVKTLQLRRALSGGFGFSLMGGKGTNFPPVICDILSDSPASKCDTMQVGDIILEINGEPVHGKTTKEVVTSLMRSPDDLILKVKEDTETRERVIKFLEPLENPPGLNQKSRIIKSSSPEKKKPIEKTENGQEDLTTTTATTSESPQKMPAEKSVVENGPDSEKPVNHTGLQSPPSGSESGAVTAMQEESPDVTKPIATEMLNSNNKNTQGNNNTHLQIPEKSGNGAVTNHAVQEHVAGVTSPTSKRGGTSVVNSKSFSSDSSLGDVPTGQVMTTVAQVHREDSTLMGGGVVAMSPSASSDRSLGEVSVSTNGNNTSSSDATVEEVTIMTPSSMAPCARLTETILENDSTGSDLSQLSETSDHTERLQGRSSDTSTPTKDRHVPLPGEGEDRSLSSPEQEWHVNKVSGPVGSNSGKDIQVNRTDSGYASASSVVTKSVTNHVQSQSTQTFEGTLDESLQENQQLPFADDADSIDGNSLSSQPDVLEGVEGATQSPRPSVASSTGSDDSEVLDMDSLENALLNNTKNLDVPSAKRLAKRLYTLDGFKRSDVAKHLSKRNDFSKLVAEEYLGYFSFHGLRIDQALRKFLSSVAIGGESQERERVLAHFSRRYYHSNLELYNSDDAVQILTCAIMLLNTDLHGQNIGRKMTVNGFINNLEGTNDGDNFPKETLKALYQSIKSKPLEWATDGEEEHKEEWPQQKPGNGTMTLNSNPFIEVQNDPNAPVYIKGYIMRKCVSEPDGRKTARGKRGWKMFYATLKGLILYLHKSEISHQMHFNTPKEALSLHHSFAARVPDYNKRPHVFSLRLANWKEYLIQCLDTQDLQNWMQAFNLAAAVHSSPPLPAAVGSQKGFKRPLLPSSSSKLALTDQLTSHESKVETLEHDLEDHRNYPPEKGARASLVKDHRAKQDFLEYEVTRFKAYVYLLHSQPTMPIGKFSLDEVMPQAPKATIGKQPGSTSGGPPEPDAQGQGKPMFDHGEQDSDTDSNQSDDSSTSGEYTIEDIEAGGKGEEGINGEDKGEEVKVGSKGEEGINGEDKGKDVKSEENGTTGEEEQESSANSDEEEESHQGDDSAQDVVDSKASFRAEERVTDENKPTHTYWELLDDDEKTNMEIVELTKEEAMKKIQEQEEQLQQQQIEQDGVEDMSTNMNNNIMTRNRWHELHQNDFDEETFL